MSAGLGTADGGCGLDSNSPHSHWGPLCARRLQQGLHPAEVAVSGGEVGMCVRGELRGIGGPECAGKRPRRAGGAPAAV